MNTKKCGKCKQTKDVSLFYVSKRCKDGYQSPCKECRNAYIRSRPDFKRQETGERTCSRCRESKPITEFQSNVRKSGGRHYHCKACDSISTRLRKYGTDGIELFNSQNGRCAICTSVLSDRWCVDHKHDATNAVRGVLCNKCNRGIGLLNDSPAVVAAALAYLRKHMVLRNYWRLT